MAKFELGLTYKRSKIHGSGRTNRLSGQSWKLVISRVDGPAAVPFAYRRRPTRGSGVTLPGGHGDSARVCAQPAKTIAKKAAYRRMIPSVKCDDGQL